MKLLLSIFLFLIFNTACSVDEQTKHSTAYYQVETDKPIEEVIDDVIFAITERNFRVTSQLHIGKAIRDRKNPDFPDYEVILYCNLDYAKKMVEFDPNLVNSCPGRINVRQEGERIKITGVLWPTDMNNKELEAQMRKMNVYVREIVDYAADDWLIVYDGEQDAIQ